MFSLMAKVRPSLSKVDKESTTSSINSDEAADRGSRMDFYKQTSLLFACIWLNPTRLHSGEREIMTLNIL